MTRPYTNIHKQQERDTHVTHTIVYDNIYMKERALLQEKLQAWLEGRYHEARVAWISMRVTPTIKQVYSRAPDNVKLAARRAFEGVLAAWFLGQDKIQAKEESDKQPIIYNMNIQVADVKAQASASSELNLTVKMEVQQIVEKLIQYVRNAMETKTRVLVGSREVEVPLIPKLSGRKLLEELAKIHKLVSN